MGWISSCGCSKGYLHQEEVSQSFRPPHQNQCEMRGLCVCLGLRLSVFVFLFSPFTLVFVWAVEKAPQRGSGLPLTKSESPSSVGAEINCSTGGCPAHRTSKRKARVPRHPNKEPMATPLEGRCVISLATATCAEAPRTVQIRI